MYQIHKWEKKANQLLKNLSSPLRFSLLIQSDTQSMQEHLEGKKTTLAYPNPAFPSCTTQSVDLVPAEEPVQNQADAYPVVMALVLCDGT